MNDIPWKTLYNDNGIPFVVTWNMKNLDKYGFIVDGKLVKTFSSADFVHEDMDSYKEAGGTAIWVKLLATTEEA
jgi:hypothetical protein